MPALGAPTSSPSEGKLRAAVAGGSTEFPPTRLSPKWQRALVMRQASNALLLLLLLLVSQTHPTARDARRRSCVS